MIHKTNDTVAFRGVALIVGGWVLAAVSYMAGVFIERNRSQIEPPESAKLGGAELADLFGETEQMQPIPLADPTDYERGMLPDFDDLIAKPADPRPTIADPHPDVDWEPIDGKSGSVPAQRRGDRHWVQYACKNGLCCPAERAPVGAVGRGSDGYYHWKWPDGVFRPYTSDGQRSF